MAKTIARVVHSIRVMTRMLCAAYRLRARAQRL
jgi:hypothetical protein